MAADHLNRDDSLVRTDNERALAQSFNERALVDNERALASLAIQDHRTSQQEAPPSTSTVAAAPIETTRGIMKRPSSSSVNFAALSPFERMNDDTWELVFSLLDPESRWHAAMTCRNWYRLIRHDRANFIWRTLNFSDCSIADVNRVLPMIFRCVVGAAPDNGGHVRELYVSGSFLRCSVYTVEDPPRSNDSIAERFWSRSQHRLLQLIEQLARHGATRLHTLSIVESYGVAVLITRIAWVMTRYCQQSLKRVAVVYDEDFINEDRVLWLLTTWPRMEKFESASEYSDDALHYIGRGWAGTLRSLRLTGPASQHDNENGSLLGLRHALERCTLLEELALGPRSQLTDDLLVAWASRSNFGSTGDTALLLPHLRHIELHPAAPLTTRGFQALREICPLLTSITIWSDFYVYRPDADIQDTDAYDEYVAMRDAVIAMFLAPMALSAGTVAAMKEVGTRKRSIAYAPPVQVEWKDVHERPAV